jgi:transcriptional regulator with XRE-family HTH domain
VSESTSGNNGKPHNDFSKRLTYVWFRRQALLGRRIEQAEIAGLVGKALGRGPFTQAAVSKWLNGDSEPNLETIRAIAKVFEADPGWLAFGEGDPPNDPAAPIPMPPRSRGPGD